MAQITSITSESLQAKIRELLPSQQGFGEDLQASNVILPTIDLTAAAQGTTTPELLQTALAFGSITAFSLSGGAATTLANSPGFWRVFGMSSLYTSAGAPTNNLSLTDGLATKQVFLHEQNNAQGTIFPFDFVIFLRSGDSLTGQASSSARLSGNYRQIADVNGVLINPVGYTPQ